MEKHVCDRCRGLMALQWIEDLFDAVCDQVWYCISCGNRDDPTIQHNRRLCREGEVQSPQNQKVRRRPHRKWGAA